MQAIVDLDGLLVNFVEGAFAIHMPGVDWQEWYSQHLGQWGFDKILGIKDFWGPLDHDFWFNLKWMSDGMQILDMILEKFDRDIVFWTDPGKTGLTGKAAWFKKHAPGFPVVYGSNKYLGSNGNTILIDDYEVNIDKFPGHSILYPRPWNRLHGVAEPLEYFKHRLDAV